MNRLWSAGSGKQESLSLLELMNKLKNAKYVWNVVGYGFYKQSFSFRNCSHQTVN